VLIAAGIFVGGLLAIAIISAASIAIYAHFVTPPSYWSEISQTLLNQPVKPTARVAEEIQDQGRSLIPLRRALEAHSAMRFWQARPSDVVASWRAKAQSEVGDASEVGRTPAPAVSDQRPLAK